MTNGSEQLEFGKGKWLEMAQGKKVFSQIVNSNCFRVVNLEGNPYKVETKSIRSQRICCRRILPNSQMIFGN